MTRAVRRPTGKKPSRTKNSFVNFISGMGGEVVNIFFHFAVRTVFIQTLGKSYLGVGSVFSNILSMLSLAELGIGSAILFKLYKPIAENNQARITVLMHFYRRVYRIIGIVIAAIGLALIPLLPLLIKDYSSLAEKNINAVLIYGLYLFRSVSSYLFFAYKRAIIKADQREYVINIVTVIGSILSSAVQIILLRAFCNFTLYVIVLILTVIFQNIAIAIIANREYPFINNRDSERISKTEVREVFKDCYALLIYKMNSVVLKATDNLVLSTVLGLDAVALYSNYYILYTHIGTVLNRVYGSVVHSLGNLHASNSTRHEYLIFRVINLITAIIGATACIGIFCVSDELVREWIGENWIIQQPFALLMGLEVYTLTVRHEMSRFRNSMGLFQQAKYRPLAGMVINLILSVLLVHSMGISGVLIGTICADWLTLVWYDPIIIHKYGFKQPEQIRGYFLRFASYTAETAAAGAACWVICRNILTGLGWISVIAHILVCGLLVPAVMLGLNWNRDEGRYIRKLLFKLLRHRKKH